MGTAGRSAISESVEIARPVDVVWNTITDWSMAHHWMPNVTACEGPRPVTAGGQLTFRYQGRPAPATIDEVAAPRHLVIRRTNGPVEAVFTYDVEETPRGALVRLNADIATDKPLRLVRKLLGLALARTDRKQLTLLKGLIEGSA